MLVAVPAQNTSRTCPCCGHVSKDNRKMQAQFKCVNCGYENNADVVGAMNILERGFRLLACGESAVKQLNEAGTRRSESAIFLAERRRNPLSLGRGGGQEEDVTRLSKAVGKSVFNSPMALVNGYVENKRLKLICMLVEEALGDDE